MTFYYLVNFLIDALVIYFLARHEHTWGWRSWLALFALFVSLPSKVLACRASLQILMHPEALWEQPERSRNLRWLVINAIISFILAIAFFASLASFARSHPEAYKNAPPVFLITQSANMFTYFNSFIFECVKLLAWRKRVTTDNLAIIPNLSPFHIVVLVEE